jgi:hypothetical protein
MNPLWVFTGPDGLLRSTEEFTQKDVVNKFCGSTSPNELVALVKKMNYGHVQVQLVSSKALNHLYSQLFQSGYEVVILQRYVKSSGTRASICRSLYRPHGQSESWVISNKE